MKILITGAAGFIGSQLAHRLWSMGEQLILIDNFSYGSFDNLIFPDHDFSKEVLKIDVRNKEGISSLLKNHDVDIIYHIAGIAPLPDCQSNPQLALDVNVGGTINILENARLFGVKKIIFASTNAIYENDVNFPTKEEGFALPSLFYPNTKYCAERFINSFCSVYGMNATCIRFANVYGPHIDCLRKQPPFVGYMIRELFFNRSPIFHSDGNQRRDYIYVEDLIDLAIKVQNSKGFDVVNCSSNKNYSVNEMYSMAQEIMNKKIKAVFAPDSHYWEKYPTLFEEPFPIEPKVLNHEINKYSLCDNSYARKKYSWCPKVEMKEGLKNVVEYEVKLLSKSN